MTLITTQDELVALCDRARSEKFVTIDTEFMRTKTYWPELCLIQMGLSSEACAIDPIGSNGASALDLSPFWDVMCDQSVLKVLHAARQDMEIFLHLMGELPQPIADTQIMATVLGYGDSAGYETLVSRLTGFSLDKAMRMTDWRQRPLSDRMIDYALADVIYLRPIYEELNTKLSEAKRQGWIEAEMAVLTTPKTYVTRPEDAWKRLKLRSLKGPALEVAKTVAAWRETEAQKRNLTRNRILRDESLFDMAASRPQSVEALAKIRGLGSGFAKSRAAKPVLEAVKRGLSNAETSAADQANDASTKPRHLKPQEVGIYELARLFLKIRSAELGVTPRVICDDAELQCLARGETDLAIFQGWRAEAFGNDVRRLSDGDCAIGLGTGNRLKIYDLPTADLTTDEAKP